MMPEVILHTAVSLDGRVDLFEPDLALFYRLAQSFEEDATLAGSETILRSGAEPDAHDASAKPPPEKWLPLLVVPDSHGRVRSWATLLSSGYWRAGVALITRSTPNDYRAYLDRVRVSTIVAGTDKVDLTAALLELADRFGVRRVRVDSGGTLNGALLRAGLVTQVSVLLHPVMVGGTSCRSMFRAPDLATPEGLVRLGEPQVEVQPGGVLWLRYPVR